MLDRTMPPALRHTLDFHLPEPVRFATSAAPECLLIPSDLHSVLRLDFVFPAGKITEQHSGVSYFTGVMLEKGTRHRSAQAVSEHLDYYSAHVDVSTGQDRVIVSLYCLSANLGQVLPLVLEMLTEPAFPADELQLAASIYSDDLRVNQEKTSWLASNRIRELVFDHHPYGRSASLDDVQALQREWLEEHFRSHYMPSHVMIAGNGQEADLRTLEDFLCRNFPGPGRTINGASAAPQPFVVRPQERQERANAVQCSIRFGRQGIDRRSEDYPALLMADHILGGFFGSRLMKNIREEKGLTYGIYSSVQQLEHASIITIGAEVNKENVELALREIRTEMTGMHSISDGELSTARHHFIGSLQNDVATIFASSEKIRFLRINRLPDTYFADLIGAIDRLPTEEVEAAAARYFNPETFSVTISG